MRYFAELSYKGTAYCGWQRQPNSPSVQQTIEEALSTILRESVEVVGAGRTDTGVHAAFYVAHFDTSRPIANPSDFVYHLNALLPEDIAFGRIYEVDDDAHARFDATSRTYHYYAHTVKSPFAYPLSWQAPAGLDFDAMNRAAALLIGRRAFTSFSKLHTDVKTNICDLRRAVWQDLGDGRHRFAITADRFLRNMVRAIVGTLVDVGRHKISPDEITAIIDRLDRSAAGTSMPAHALFLSEVTYPYPLL